MRWSPLPPHWSPRSQSIARPIVDTQGRRHAPAGLGMPSAGRLPARTASVRWRARSARDGTPARARPGRMLVSPTRQVVQGTLRLLSGQVLARVVDFGIYLV